jgi:hypothetical protein
MSSYIIQNPTERTTAKRLSTPGATFWIYHARRVEP